jgi:prepilin-type N-terminal cleavage/methylation domain-containing protein
MDHPQSSKNCKAGFSLIEVLVVIVLILVISGIALPNMINVVSNARLRGGATNLAGMFQSTRMLAIKENRTKTARFDVLANGPVAFVKNAGDTSNLLVTDPQVQLGAPLTRFPTPSGGGAPAAIDSATLGFTAVTTDPSFNSRGIPCAWTVTGCPVSGFIYYFKDRRPFGQSGWTAVSISPAGRVKRWVWNGSVWGD